jgi:hypothetical protein
MKKTLQDQYLLIKEGKGHVGVFLTEAKRQFPNIVRNAATLDEAVASLKSKNIIAENVFSVMPAILDRPKKESYETAFEAFLAEAKKNEDEKVKAEEKKVSKPVEEDLEKAFDYSNEKNPDNMIFDQIMTGYYAEMKDPKNADKTMQQLKDIVFKNLEKDPIYYTKNGQFGVKDLGYVTEAPGLGEPKEAKGKYKSSGYGDLKEGVEKFMSGIEDLATKKDDKNISPEQIAAKLLQKKVEDHKRRKEAGEPYDETLLREVIRKMIDEELFNAGAFEDSLYTMEQPHLGDKEALGTIEKIYTRHAQGINSISRNLQENTFKKGDKVTYLGNPAKITFVGKDQMGRVYYSVSYDKGNGETKASNLYNKGDEIEPIEEGVLGVRDNDVDYNIPLPLPVSYSDDKNVAHYSSDDRYSSQEDLLDPEDYFENIKDLSYGDAFNYLEELGLEIDEIETILNSLSKSSLRESVEKDLADINKEAEHEVLQAKLDKIDTLIDHRRSKLSKLDEDEDMKALTDKKKVKELEKDIKKLEVARKKIEKMMSKFKGKKAESKEVIDEDETPLEASEEYKRYQKNAERRYDEGEDIDSIIDTYTNISQDMKDKLRDDLEGKMDGMDF